MINQIDVHVAGVDYKITQFTATKALTIEAKLIKLLGPAFMELQSAASDNDGEKVLAAAIAALIEQMDKIDVVQLVKELVGPNVTKGTAAINFDMEFAGNTGALFELVKEVLKANFADVFSKLGLNIGV